MTRLVAFVPVVATRGFCAAPAPVGSVAWRAVRAEFGGSEMMVGVNIRAFFAIAILALPPVVFGQIKVLMSGGFSSAYQELLPEFEKTTGIAVTTARGPSQGDGPTTIKAQLRRGVAADMVILSKEGLDELIAEGTIAVGTAVDLAQAPLGIAVRAGARKPDIRTVAAFKETMLHAKSIGLTSTTGIYLTTKLFPQLGIASAVSGKITGGQSAEVARGETELTILPVSELLHATGVDFVGTIPQEIQMVSVFSAAVLKDCKEPEPSKRLIAFLASDKAIGAIRKSGMQPLGRH